jgi:hypothetical protein
MAIFDETYRIIAVESHRLTIRGNISGEVLTIAKIPLEHPLTQEELLVGQLIALTDPLAPVGN